MQNRLEAADTLSVADSSDTMTDNQQPTFWQRYRMPIILGVIAVCLYLGSIVWMVFGRGQVA